MNSARFARSLSALDAGSGTVEINTHPGEAGDPELDRFRWGYHWADELAMLVAPADPRRLLKLQWFRRLGTLPAT